MKIGVNTLFMIPGEVGGTETYLRHTLLAMVTVSPETGLVLFTNRENDRILREKLAECEKVEFIRLDFSAANRYARIVREQLELPGKVRLAGVDVLWSPGYTMPYRTCCPQVVTIHDMQYKNHPDDFTILVLIVTGCLVEMAARRSRRIIAVSQFTKKEIVKYTSVSEKKIDVIHEAVDPAFGLGPDAGTPHRLAAALTGSDKPYILTVANSYPHKNLDSLAKAFCLLERRIPHILIIVGKPGLGEKKLEDALTGLGDPSRVVRLSGLVGEDLISLYQGADLFVFPTLYEGFGLPILEAMAARVPVVTSRFASVPEVGGNNAIYCDVNNSSDLSCTIEEVLARSPRERDVHLTAAQSWAARFSWKKTARQTLASLRKASCG